MNDDASSPPLAEMSRDDIARLVHDLQERNKELRLLHELTAIGAETTLSIEAALQKIVELIPPAWQYPEDTCGRITVDDLVVQTANFRSTAWRQSSPIVIDGSDAGVVEVFYLAEKPEQDEGPFLREERALVDSLARQIARIFERRRFDRSLRATNQELEANNQQLRATEQQLRAYNQQLEATNQQLRTTTDRLSAIVAASPEAIFSLTPEGEVTTWNRAAEEMFGWSADQVVGRPLPIVPPNKQEEFAALRERVCSGEAFSGVEVDRLRRGGQPITINLSTAPLRYESGRVTGIMAIAADLTERKAMKAELLLSEARFRAAFDNASIGRALTLPDGRLNRVNETLCEMLGYSASDLEEKTFTAITHPDDVEESRECVRCLLAGEKESYRLEKRYLHRDGHFVWTDVSTTLLRDEHGEPLNFITDIVDITDKKRAEEARREADARFRIAQEMSPDGFTILRPVRDASGRVVDFVWVYENAAIARLNGTDPEEVVGERLLELFPGHRGTPFFSAYQRVAETGQAYAFEDGYSGESMPEPIWLRIVVVPMDGDIAVLAQDITERKQAEEDIRAANQQLDASNQQLKATEQQLRAYNQQLAASEAALRLSEEKYRTLVEGSLQGVVIAQAGPVRLTFANTAMESLSGYAIDELTSMGPAELAQLIHPEDRERFFANFKRRVAGETVPPTAEYRLLRKDGATTWAMCHSSAIDYLGEPATLTMFVDITERKQQEEALRRIEWMLTPDHSVAGEGAAPSYGDLTALNTERTILDSVGVQVLEEIVHDYLDLLDTSAAVYERNGDYALGIFASGWCRYLDEASRRLCDTDDDAEALACGRWHCHESCWTEASRTAIERGEPTDIECAGGLRLRAVPIRAGDRIVGAINFGYGDPPRDPQVLRDLATKYDVSVDALARYSESYESRPPYIVEMAKRRIESSARLIGEIIERKQAEEDILAANQQLRATEQQLRASNLQLRESEERFRQVYEHMAVGVARVSLDMRIEQANEAYCEMLGYTEEQLMGLHLQDITQPEIVEENLRRQAELIAGEIDHFRMEKAFIHKDGHVVHGILDACLVRTDLDEPAYCLGSVVDITERKRTEKEMARRTAELAALYAGAQSVLAGGDFETMARSLFDKAREVTGARSGYVALLSDSGEENELLFLESGGLACSVDPSLPMPIRGLREVAYESGEVALDNDFMNSSWVSFMPEGHVALDNVLFAPLPIEGRTVGIIGLANKPGGFEEDDRTFAAAMGQLAAVALQKWLAEKEVRSERDRLQVVMQTAPVAILMADEHERILQVNRAAEALFGTTGDITDEPLRCGEVIACVHRHESPGGCGQGESCASCEVYRAIRDGLAGVTVDDLETEIHIENNGTSARRQILLSAAPLRLGHRPGVILAANDITQMRALHAKMAQSDRLSSMGMLAAGVAHEINNPLSYVLYNLESMTEDLPKLLDDVRTVQARFAARHDAPSVGETDPLAQTMNPAMLDDILNRFEDALGGTRRIRDIARGLGTFSRVERDKPVPVNLMHVIEVAINMSFNEIKYRARLIKEYGRIPTIMASEGRLSQVFLNLIINATHAIEEGDVDNNEIRVRTWSDKSHVYAEVQDSGSGIAAENMGNLFEPFFSTKEIGRGSGLGLAISKNIIEGYGGDISVESEVGKGTSFILRIPILKEAEATEGKQVADATSTEAKGRILIVDDEDGIRSAMVRMLRGHEAVEASSGAAARQLLEKDQGFDLILCDMMMPAVSGMDLHQWLLANHPVLAERLIFVTGGAFTPKAREYLSKVDNLRLEKPFDVANFKKIVNDHVTLARGGRDS